MTQKLFSLKTLHELGDGALEQDFDAVLQAVVKDCLARPTIDRAREVKLVVQVKPKPGQDGVCDDVEVNVQVASKAPAKVVPPYRMRATVNGGLRYAPGSPDNPDQSSLPFDGDDGKED